MVQALLAITLESSLRNCSIKPVNKLQCQDIDSPSGNKLPEAPQLTFPESSLSKHQKHPPPLEPIKQKTQISFAHTIGGSEYLELSLT